MNNKIGSSTDKENVKSDQLSSFQHQNSNPNPLPRAEDPHELPYRSKFGNDIMAQSLRSNEYQNLRDRSTSKEERENRYDESSHGGGSNIQDRESVAGHTSFRQRIEGLLPDRLKTQY